MKLLKYRVFTSAVVRNPHHEMSIQALYSFLINTTIENKLELLSAFPYAKEVAPGTWEIAVANQKLFFIGVFDFENQTVISEKITTRSVTEGESHE